MTQNKFMVFDIETGVLKKGGKTTDGLSPLTACISCIGYKIHGSNEGPVCISGDFEKRIIEEFVWAFESSGCNRLVTFNGWAFDIPFIRVRAMVHGIKLPLAFWNDACLVDPYHILARNKSGKQSEFALLFGRETVGNGLECLVHFEKGEFKKIEAHCQSDVLALDAIFSKMLDSGLGEVL